ncbi:hypothetical protein GCM10011519_18800 [Marmoricola endophyticus]|uniref:Uncharacterized protein n=1 Tax=Marmoricola endophyticus TaxID=2040280 RepID=A0A917F3F5_9ACTN|nr:hypothetical protein [Marmoricola endophyticus]GGF45195.1 hypothetical protein GCM10011519_18800 [Marmoricola endophyticus]
MVRFLFVILLLAAVIYAVFWAINRRNDGPQQPAGPRGPVGPDDDEDFLRQLDWERRRDAHRKQQGEGGDTGGDPPPAPTG